MVLVQTTLISTDAETNLFTFAGSKAATPLPLTVGAAPCFSKSCNDVEDRVRGTCDEKHALLQEISDVQNSFVLQTSYLSTSFWTQLSYSTLQIDHLSLSQTLS